MYENTGTITATQAYVLHLLSTGKNYKQIAGDLDIKRATAQRHAQMARARIGAVTVIQAVAMYVISQK